MPPHSWPNGNLNKKLRQRQLLAPIGAEILGCHRNSGFALSGLKFCRKAIQKSSDFAI